MALRSQPVPSELAFEGAEDGQRYEGDEDGEPEGCRAVLPTSM